MTEILLFYRRVELKYIFRTFDEADYLSQKGMFIEHMLFVICTFDFTVKGCLISSGSKMILPS